MLQEYKNIYNPKKTLSLIFLKDNKYFFVKIKRCHKTVTKKCSPPCDD